MATASSAPRGTSSEVNERDDRGRTALHRAAIAGCKNTVQRLLESPLTNVNLGDNNGLTPLILASAFDHTEVVRLLLQKRGIDINLKATADGYSALHYASVNGSTEVVRLLLQERESMSTLRTVKTAAQLFIWQQGMVTKRFSDCYFRWKESMST